MRVMFDISSVVWNYEEYSSHAAPFYEIAAGANRLFPLLEDFQADVLLREEMAHQIMASFPISTPPRDFQDLQQVFYKFIGGQARITVFNADASSNLSSLPDLRGSYSGDILAEVDLLLAKLIEDGNTSVAFVTVKGCWPKEYIPLTVTSEDNSFEYRTVLADNGDDLKEFFGSLRKVFEHKEKHDRVTGHKINKGEIASSLSCYDGVDPTYVQSLLDDALEDGNYFYGFDKDNGVWVIFRRKKGNKYYGYDAISDSEIPDKFL